jgi:hypothetical protein
MSVIRKLKSGKWQVLIRKANQPHVIKSFFDKETTSNFTSYLINCLINKYS